MPFELVLQSLNNLQHISWECVKEYTDKELIQRSWFIMNGLSNIINDNNIDKEFKKIEKISYIWHNMNNLKCKYSDDITENILSILTNYHC